VKIRRAAGCLGGVAATCLLLGCGSPSPGEHSSAMSPCRSGDYVLALSPNGATGGIVAIAQIRSSAAASCRLATQLRFAVQHAGGSLVTQIEGNPAHVQISAALTPSTVLVHDWLWRNWCGPGGHFRFVASTAAGRFAAYATPPRCAAPGSPSRLTRVPGAG